MFRNLIISFAFTVGGTASLVTPASIAEAAEIEATQRRLVIIGASYAGEWGEPQLPGFAVTNKGVDGETSTQVRARFEQDVVALQPDAVIIWGHYNDIVRVPADQAEQAKSAARENYKAMVAGARQAGIEPMLVAEITLPVPDSWTEALISWVAGLLGKQDYRSRINGHVKEVNEWLRDFARSEQVRLLDLERALDSGNGTRRLEFTRDDGSHVSPAGYAAITEYVRGQLR